MDKFKKFYLFLSIIFLLFLVFLTSSFISKKQKIKVNSQGEVEGVSFLKIKEGVDKDNLFASPAKSKRPKKDITVSSDSSGQTTTSSTSSTTSTSTSANTSTNTSTSVSIDSVIDNFSTNRIIEETSGINLSLDSNWWVNSGGRFIVENGLGSTILGDLLSSDKWFKEYSTTNSLDTDGGKKPQNLLRFVRKDQWKNFSQQVYFKIDKINMTDSPNRNASNGVLLFNRYQSGDNLYYAGVRVDGAVVIKKKMDGVYYTMGYKKVFDGLSYNFTSNPNLLPINTWMGIKVELIDNTDGEVSIKLFLDRNKSGNWVEELSVLDKPGLFGSSVISSFGYAGIRTDFMDVYFDDYQIKSI